MLSFSRSKLSIILYDMSEDLEISFKQVVFDKLRKSINYIVARHLHI